MTEETRRQIKQYETRPDSNYVSINAGTLEQIIDDALQAQRERLVMDIVEYWGHLDNDGFGKPLKLSQEEQRKDILNLINPPSKE